MGANESSVNFSSSKESFQSLILVKKLGQCKSLYENPQSKNRYISTQHTFATSQQLESFQSQLRKKNQLNHIHYLSAIQSFTITNVNICSKQHKLIQIFPYQSHTLWQEVQNRMIHKKNFGYREIWSILCSCVLAMGHFTRNQICLYTLSPYDIVLNSEGNVKILPMQMSDFIFDYEIKKDYYYAPEMLKAMKCTTHVALNNKAGVFTLALTIIHLINLKPMSFLYDFEEMTIDFTALNKLVDNISDDDIRQIICKMVKPAAYERITFTQLEDMLYGILQSKGTQEDQVSVLEDSICRVVNDLKDQKANCSFGNQTLRIKYRGQGHANSMKISQPLQRDFQDCESPIYTYAGPDFLKIDEEDKDKIKFDKLDYSGMFCKNSNLDKFKDGNYYDNSLFDISNFQNNKVSSVKLQSQKNSSLLSQFPQQSQNQHKQANNGLYGKYFVTEEYNRGKYQGYKQNGMRHGFGTFYYQEGGKYCGQWFQNKMEGRGALYYTCGNIAYQGQWKKDQLHGEGVLYNQNPRYSAQKINWQRLDTADPFWVKYQGFFKEDLKQGEGTLYFSNGQVFKGFFKSDLPEGYGSFKCSDGDLVKGLWSKGVFVSQGRYN